MKLDFFQEYKFLEKGFSKEDFFRHTAIFLNKQYPDTILHMGRRGISFEGQKIFQLNIYSDKIDGLQKEIFFDKQISWHQQHLGNIGLIACAGFYIDKDDIYIVSVQSDIVQQIGKNPKFHNCRSKIRIRFDKWYKSIFNALLNYGYKNNIKNIYCTTSELVIKNTKKQIDFSLFKKIYDYPSTFYNCKKDNGYWIIKVSDNLDKIIEPDPVFQKSIMVLHDIEENCGHEKEILTKGICEKNLKFALEIEKKHKANTTYSIVGKLFKSKIRLIDDNHSIAFHTFNHDNNDLGQLEKVREVNLQVRGYRAARSIITSELSDYNLLLHNFEWLVASCAKQSLNSQKCFLENGIVKIPILIDDHRMYDGRSYTNQDRVPYELWLEMVEKIILENDVVTIGMHDCYSNFWIEQYDNFIGEMKRIGNFITCDQIANNIFLNTNE